MRPKRLSNVPQFSADSAYHIHTDPSGFGPRVPNTAAHKACGEFLAKKLEASAAKVYNQHADLVAIRQHHPESAQRHRRL